MRATTDGYREESDPLTEFLTEECIIDPEARASVAALWATYDFWARQDNRERWPLDRRTFNQRMEKRFKKGRHGHKRDWYWFGLCRKIDNPEQGTPTDADKRADENANLRILSIDRSL